MKLIKCFTFCAVVLVTISAPRCLATTTEPVPTEFVTIIEETDATTPASDSTTRNQTLSPASTAPSSSSTPGTVSNATNSTPNTTNTTPNTTNIGTTSDPPTLTGNTSSTLSTTTGVNSNLTETNTVTGEIDVSTTLADKTTNVSSTQSTEFTSTLISTTEQTTTQSPSMTTEPASSQKVTTPMPEPQSPTPNYPEPTFPDVVPVDGAIPVIRQLSLEVAVNNVGCEATEELTGAPCDALEREFKDFAEAKYQNVSGFLGISTVTFSRGSVIIKHDAIYEYNKMTSDDKQLSAEDIYSRTLAPSVDNKQSFGSSNFTECENCQSPQELSNLCNKALFSVTCKEGLEPFCENNVWLCQSPCANMEELYCSEISASCTQGPADTTPTCSCTQSKDGWYIGARCQFYVDRIWLIVGFSVGAGVVLIIILVLTICLCQMRKQLKESRKMPFEKTNEAFLLGNDDLEIDNVADSHEMDDFVNRGYLTNDDEASPKPYSYVYAADVNTDYGRKGSKGVVSHENNPELDRALQERANADKKNQNQSFWGNLEHEVIQEVPKSAQQNQRNASNVYESKPNVGKQQANGYSQKRPQSAFIPPADYDLSSTDPFSKRYSQIVSDSYGKSKKNY